LTGIVLFLFSAELQRRRELGIVFRKRDKGSGQHIEDKEEKLKYSILLKSKNFINRLLNEEFVASFVSKLMFSER